MNVSAKIGAAVSTMAIAAIGLTVLFVFAIEYFSRQATDIYDGPMMTINFTRSAHSNALIASQQIDLSNKGDVAFDPDTLEFALDDLLTDLEVVAERTQSKATSEIVAPLLTEAEETLDAFFEALENDAALPATMATTLEKVTDQISTLIDAEAEFGYLLRERIQKEKLQAGRILAGFTGFALLVAGLLAWLIGRKITRRLNGIKDAMTRVADGHLTETIPSLEDRDEIGKIAQVLAQFTEKLSVAAQANAREIEVQQNNAKVVRLLGNALVDLANGDFRNHVTEFFPVEHKKLRYQINDAMLSLSQVISEVSAASSNVWDQTREIAHATTQLSARTEEQSNTLQDTSSAVKLIGSKIEIASQKAGVIEEIVVDARKKAESSGAVVEATISAMQEIEGSSDQISQIVSVIDDIAFQTNLLALNAGVEAARAGDAGRGFAVVASEVRALAQRSSGAAQEIKVLIEKSGQHVRNGVNLVGQTSSALEEIVSRVHVISTQIDEIGSTSHEQTMVLDEINACMDRLENVTQRNVSMVDQTANSMQILQGASDAMSNLVSRFLIEGAEGASSHVPMSGQDTGRAANAA